MIRDALKMLFPAFYYHVFLLFLLGSPKLIQCLRSSHLKFVVDLLYCRQYVLDIFRYYWGLNISIRLSYLTTSSVSFHAKFVLNLIFFEVILRQKCSFTLQVPVTTQRFDKSFGLVWFYGISTIVDYLMTNLFLCT